MALIQSQTVIDALWSSCGLVFSVIGSEFGLRGAFGHFLVPARLFRRPRLFGRRDGRLTAPLQTEDFQLPCHLFIEFKDFLK